MEVRDFNKIIVNAVDYADVKVFCVAFYRAMAAGKVFMFRTAAAVVKVMGGITDQPLPYQRKMIVKEEQRSGGIIVVGSHTDKTTRQVEELKKLTDVEFIELDATLVKMMRRLKQKCRDVSTEKKHASVPAKLSAVIQRGR